MARQTLRRLFYLRAQFQDVRHTFADVSGQSLVGAAMLILADPRRIFVLQNPAACNGLHASVTARRRTRTRADIFDGLILRRKQGRDRYEPCAQNHAEDARV